MKEKHTSLAIVEPTTASAALVWVRTAKHKVMKREETHNYLLCSKIAQHSPLVMLQDSLQRGTYLHTHCREKYLHTY